MEAVKYNTQRTVMTLAHTIAKSLNDSISYVKRLGQAIKMAWLQIKSASLNSSKTPMLDNYSHVDNKIESAKQKIENGGKWNGIVYGKRKNKNYSFISVYVSGVEFWFEANNEDVEQLKNDVKYVLDRVSISKKSVVNNYGYYGDNTKGFDGIED